MEATVPAVVDVAATSDIPPVSTASPEAGGCLNCTAPLTGAYCAECGQPAHTARISFPGVIRGAVSYVLNVDSNLLRTARALLRAPGPFVREFVAGRRKDFTGPLPYYLLIVGLNVAVSALLDHREPAPRTGSEPPASFWDENFLALQLGVVFGSLMIPLAAARRLLHRRAGYNVAEHFVALIYVMAQSVLLTMPVRMILDVAGPFDADVEGIALISIFLSYAVWMSRGFLAEPSWKVALKLLAACGLTVVVVGALAAVLMPLVAGR